MVRRFDRARRALEPALRRVLHVYWRLARAHTLGVRAVVLDAHGRALLVKHSYASGWHLPGGGVEVGESMAAALVRELAEEAHIAITEPPVLHGVFHNARISRRDHVAVYVIRSFRQDSVPEPNYEIVDTGFFAPGALPPGTTRGTRERIDEVLSGRPAPDRW